MYAYAMLGTNGLERAVRFYEPLMALLGQARAWTGEEAVSWGDFDGPGSGFAVGRPFDGAAAGVGNGSMLAFRARDSAAVRRLHAQALAGGGTDEGAPGPRPQYGPGFYAGYVRDPDGNKLAFVCDVRREGDGARAGDGAAALGER